MSARMKVDIFPSIRVSSKLKEQTVTLAEREQENLSEYIRRAVEERNAKMLKENDKKLYTKHLKNLEWI